jgi:hypothetical protein
MFGPSQRWLGEFADLVWRTLRNGGDPANCCVVAARLGSDVARAFGYLPVPVPVRVRVQRGREVTVLPGPNGGVGRRGAGFAGHLVLWFPAVDGLVDFTAPQFHDPRRGLLVPEPLYGVGVVTRQALERGFSVNLPTGVRISYREMPDEVGWKAEEAWAGVPPVVTGAVVRQLRAAVVAWRSRPVRVRGQEAG